MVCAEAAAHPRRGVPQKPSTRNRPPNLDPPHKDAIGDPESEPQQRRPVPPPPHLARLTTAPRCRSHEARAQQTAFGQVHADITRPSNLRALVPHPVATGTTTVRHTLRPFESSPQTFLRRRENRSWSADRALGGLWSSPAGGNYRHATIRLFTGTSPGKLVSRSASGLTAGPKFTSTAFWNSRSVGCYPAVSSPHFPSLMARPGAVSR
ncbi:hypothetical protein GWK47_045673 [Chionoecetes opilio]|uniref:Uncharacterized protein n=1 Tax=Chionoecetes opilio TaxID=41210 RepID=A0A8J4Y7Y7_CHIOP|nr:hypothetical protein GWK47_045673 [Chionoecetes opilio]